MRQILTFALLLTLISLIGCNSHSGSGSDSGSGNNSVLTKEKAQKAVDNAISGQSLGGSVVVTGIQEKPQENAAQADLRFENFRYKNPALGLRTYTGEGIAVIKHYNDGRWTLTKISLTSNFDAFNTSVDIE